MELLSDLDAAGISLAADGEALRFRTPPGVSIGPYVDRITANKSALLAAVRQRELDADVALLERGWAWLSAHRDDPRHETFEARWIERLRRYERSYAEAVSRELDPTLSGARADRRPIEATVPPSHRDGALPGECGWPKTCGVLGPCPRSLASRPCRLDVP
jgi:hypothetical protein